MKTFTAIVLSLVLVACGGASFDATEPTCSKPTAFYFTSAAIELAKENPGSYGGDGCYVATAAPGTWLRTSDDATLRESVVLGPGVMLTAVTCDDTREPPLLERCEP